MRKILLVGAGVAAVAVLYACASDDSLLAPERDAAQDALQAKDASEDACTGELQRKSVVEKFVTLPEDTRYPEGITSDPATKAIYVATFDFYNEARFKNKLFRYGPDGKLQAAKEIGAPVLGIELNTRDNKIYITNWGASKIQRIPKDFTESTPFEDVVDVPKIGAPPGERVVFNPDGTLDTLKFGLPKPVDGGTGLEKAFPSPNVPIFANNGDLYFSDSFQGAVFKVPSPHACTATSLCTVETFVQHPDLATAGFPAFGANGLAFTSSDESALLICNTGDDRILKLNMSDRSLAPFAESIDGCDGFARDPEGRLWVAENQGDFVSRLDDKGKILQRVGGFEGLDGDARNRSSKGLLFPTNITFLDGYMYVANLSQYYTANEGDEVEEEVNRYTISRIKLSNIK